MIIYDRDRKLFFKPNLGVTHGFTKLPSDLAAGTNIYAPQQVHGSVVTVIKSNRVSKSSVFIPDADGLLYQSSDLKPVCLYVRTADCLPILLVSKKDRLIGVIHVGWQGAYQGILSNLGAKLKELKIDPKNLKVIFGPSINGGCYNITMSRYKLLLKQFPLFASSLYRSKGQYYFSLLSFAYQKLIDLGFKKLNFSWRLFCTHCQDEDFYSYRKGSRQKSLISYICNYE